MLSLNDLRIGIIGLGYVGLPLAVEFGKTRSVIGFDISDQRIDQLRRGEDETREVEVSDLLSAKYLELTSNPEVLSQCNFYIVTVPTPIDADKNPDLTPLEQASKTVGSFLKSGDLVVYESTVYPGATEEFSAPILEEVSGLKLNRDFHIGYSPERINPGDKQRSLTKITKVTSGSTNEAALLIDALYASIIEAGTYMAPSIKVAEAAKVIENTQRDLNIALINELAVIFNMMEIDTGEVLAAARTKWNFLNFQPGLVGGHCIGVDPYYLTYRAQMFGYEPNVILAGRRINDNMADYVATQVVNALRDKNLDIPQTKALVMGFSFKEDCPDIRNTKVADLIQQLQNSHMSVDVYDPVVNQDEAAALLGFDLIEEPKPASYDAVILAVPHNQIRNLPAVAIKQYVRGEGVIYDIKQAFSIEEGFMRL